MTVDFVHQEFFPEPCQIESFGLNRDDIDRLRKRHSLRFLCVVDRGDRSCILGILFYTLTKTSVLVYDICVLCGPLWERLLRHFLLSLPKSSVVTFWTPDPLLYVRFGFEVISDKLVALRL